VRSETKLMNDRRRFFSFLFLFSAEAATKSVADPGGRGRAQTRWVPPGPEARSETHRVQTKRFK
jgi:hypothetical protein